MPSERQGKDGYREEGVWVTILWFKSTIMLFTWAEENLFEELDMTGQLKNNKELTDLPESLKSLTWRPGTSSLESRLAGALVQIYEGVVSPGIWRNSVLDHSKRWKWFETFLYSARGKEMMLLVYLEWGRVPFAWEVLDAQLCLTLCDPIDGCPPGSSCGGTYKNKMESNIRFLPL